MKKTYWGKKNYKKLLYVIFEEQLELYYPDNIDQIKSLTDISEETGASETTVRKWKEKFLEEKYGEEEATVIASKVWPSMKDLAYTWEIEKDMVEARGGKLLTDKETFDNGGELLEYNRCRLGLEQDELPTTSRRYVKARCGKKNCLNEFYTSGYSMNAGYWCPTCNSLFCESVLRKFAESLFPNSKFPKTRFSVAYGYTSDEEGGREWDGYNERIKIGDNEYRISLEYDAGWHDEIDGCYSLTEEDVRLKQQADELKDSIAFEKEHTIVVRLKEVKGYTRKSINDNWLGEIVRQIGEGITTLFPERKESIKSAINNLYKKASKLSYDFKFNNVRAKGSSINPSRLSVGKVDNFLGDSSFGT